MRNIWNIKFGLLFTFPLLLIFSLYGPAAYAQSSIEFQSSSYTVTEGDMIPVPLIRSGGSSGEVIATIKVTGITATGGIDFARAEGNPTEFEVRRRWINGEVLDRTHGGYKTLNIQTLLDSDYYEGTESLRLEITNVNGGYIGYPSVTTIYIEDDYYNPWTPTTNPGTISFTEANYYMYEDDYLSIPLERSGGSDGEVSVDINIRGITASGGSDFIRAEGNPTDFNLTRRWLDGEIEDRTHGGYKTVNIQSLADSDIWEGTESFVLEMVDITNGNYGAITKTTVHIFDDTYVDPWNAGSISFASSSYSVREGDVVRVPMVRSGGSSGEVSVNISIRGVSATAGDDFRRAEGNAFEFDLTRRWIDGEVEDRTHGGYKTVNIQAMADQFIGEGIETLVLQMTDISGGSFGAITQATVSIQDASSLPIPTIITPTDNCVYPGGDTTQWGWDNVRKESCAPKGNTVQPPTVTQPAPTQPTTPLPTSSNCVYPGGDTTQWGWDNIRKESCKPLGNTIQPPTTTQPTAPLPSASNCVYPGGDTTQWGWDDVAKESCAPLGATTHAPTTSQPVTPFLPASNCRYPRGDTSQWGWDDIAKVSCAPLS